MNFDAYNQKMTLIHNELKKIAEMTANQAMLGIANPSNPNFIALMQRHSQLTKLSSELTDWMMQQFQNS